MPLIARNKKTNERINILTVENPRSTFVKDEIVCPLCGEPMYVADGLIRSAYFSHYADCSSDYKVKPESAEHRFFKAYLGKMLQEHMNEYSNATLTFEYPIPEKKRIADVAFEFASGWVVAHEIQLSSITVEEISERTSDYREAGIDIHWWLGGSGNSEAVNTWCRKEFGGCFVLDYVRAREHIAIHEALKQSTG